MDFNILVVDDSKVTRMMIGRALRMAGVPIRTIIEAENGTEGLRKMRALLLMEKEPFTLVIADINMPQMNGVDMVKQMRENPALSQVPVVVISTEGSQTRIDELRSLGVKAYLRKPFTPEDIRDTLKSVVGDWENDSEERCA